jgi:uncharacterized 2Fe-2S/4Fe-4S cluster protein (DUF4445 family)
MSNEIVNEQITKTLEATHHATLTGDVVRHSGSGKAFQSVSQTVAITIQDAADQLRNMSTIGTTATGMAIAQLLEKGDVAEYEVFFSKVQGLMTASTDNFKSISQSASQVMSDFPTGDE